MGKLLTRSDFSEKRIYIHCYVSISIKFLTVWIGGAPVIINSKSQKKKLTPKSQTTPNFFSLKTKNRSVNPLLVNIRPPPSGPLEKCSPLRMLRLSWNVCRTEFFFLNIFGPFQNKNSWQTFSIQFFFSIKKNSF